MATGRQIDLSDFIKSIHKKLRGEARVLGIEQAWQNHCEDTENLEKYAKAMQELAVNYWDWNSKKDSKAISRIFWVYEACTEYFIEIGKYRDKELRISKKHLKNEGNLVLNTPLGSFYTLLDVGSCYNPFKQFEVFNVIPIDIAPAISEVLKCDFLNIRISDSLLFENGVVTDLPKGHFDVIVFSLLLEYFPTPELRLKCCLNAYNLLKTEGILVIVTPDSNHIGSNAKTIKSWRYVLAKHGFMRVKYEKLPYLHCMLFRKASLKEVAKRWAEVHAGEEFFEQIFIPQDFQDNQKDKSEPEQNEDIKNPLQWSSESFLQCIEF